VADYR